MGNSRDDDRKNRLAAALRENLKRRKQQAKGRARGCGAGATADDPGADEGGPGAHDPAEDAVQKPR